MREYSCPRSVVRATANKDFTGAIFAFQGVPGRIVVKDRLMYNDKVILSAKSCSQIGEDEADAVRYLHNLANRAGLQVSSSDVFVNSSGSNGATARVRYTASMELPVDDAQRFSMELLESQGNQMSMARVEVVEEDRSSGYLVPDKYVYKLSS
jgi:hypothetical protein